jgi:hypothetical protein
MTSTLWHNAFATALTHPEQQPPTGVVRYDGQTDMKRFNVYRNNHMMSLINNLKDGFPVVLALVGDEFFGHMAKAFIYRHPPSSPVMVFYGEDFPSFIDQFEPAASLPYLADIARLEYHQRLSLHAADTPFLDRTTVPSEALTLLNANVNFHPSFQLMYSDFPIFDIWYANQGHLDHQIRDEGQHIAMIRHRNTVTTFVINPECHTFLTALQNGQSIRQAANYVTADFVQDIQKWMSLALDMSSSLLLKETKEFT